MKRITITATLIIITITGLLAMGNSRINSQASQKGKTDFEKLWKEFNATVRSDRALKGLKVLEEIKTLAEEERSAWNFYKAAEEYWRTASQRDWKQEDSLRNAFQEEIKRYNEPIVTFYNSRNDLRSKAPFLRDHKEQLLASHNPDFHKASYPSHRVFSPVLNESLSNDYEYALWYLYLGTGIYVTSDWEVCTDILKEYVGDKYPLAQFIEFNQAYQNYFGTELINNLQAYAGKYQDRAVALFATQELLRLEFEELGEKKASSDEYKAFRQKCADFETYRNKFKGTEEDIADCCTKVSNIIEQMDAKSIEASVSDGKLTISTQNIAKVDIEILTMDKKGKTGKAVHKATVKNTVRSYYLTDTLTYDIPTINDGIYSLVCSEGKVKSSGDYHRFTVSMSDKQDKDGHHIYAAEAVSGRPLKKAAVSLVDEDDQVTAIAEGLDFSDGYIALPQAIRDEINDSKTQHLVCSYTDADGVLHSSAKYYLYQRYNFRTETGSETYYAQLIVDRSAFQPDETAHFKGVVFCGNRRESLRTVPEGEKVTVRLRDAENNILDTKDLYTNEFGSVAGEFALARGRRNGLYTIELIHNGRKLESRSVRVDDFVLPTFTLAFEPDRNFYLPGDKITVKGKVTSYSGHSLSGADIRYTVTEQRTVKYDDKLQVSDDGSFTISFDSNEQDARYYTIELKVTDNTGETLSWSTTRNTFGYIPFTMNVLNQAEGEVHFLRDEKNTRFVSQYIVSDDVLRLGFDVNYSGQTLKRDNELKISYKLKYGGTVIANGNAEPGEKIDIPLGGRPSGLYQLEAESICPREGYDDLKAGSECDILLVRETDSAVDAGIENVFKVIDGDKIGLLFGSTAGETWANIDVYGAGNVLLAHKFIDLRGVRGEKGSLESILFDFEDSWSNVVDVQILYFRNNSVHSFYHRFDRTAERLVMPLSFTRFEDRTRPGTEYTFEISTLAGAECAATIFDKSTESIMSNLWSQVHLYSPQAPDVIVRNECGSNDSYRDYVVVGYGAARGGGRAKLSAATDDIVLDEEVAMPAPSRPVPDVRMNMAPPAPAMAKRPDSLPETEAVEEGAAEPVMRENFANTIAFEPYLRSDSQGRIKFNFKNADKLSTYYVQLWAHDKEMHNAVLRKEMTVTIPVKLSVVEPQFLYTGDKYILQASVSSTVAETVTGRLKVEWYDGDSRISSEEKNVSLRAMGSDGYEFPIIVPAVAELGVKLTFISTSEDHGSDAVMVKIPVSPAVQTITEAHSAILRSGESKEELLSSLRAMFVNTSGDNAQVCDLSILDMVREAVPGHIEPASKNLLDMTDALYARRIAATLAAGSGADGAAGSGGAGAASASGIGAAADGEKAAGETLGGREVTDAQLISDISACRNSDGGFAWFAGMDSSPVITATLLSRIASLRQHGLVDDKLAAVFTDEVIAKAVSYLDKAYFGERGRPEWCGGLSFSQYVAVRSCFSEVELKANGLNRTELRSFRQGIRSYLVPGKKRGLNAMIYEKARRMRVMYQLISSENGGSLAKSWGIRLFTLRRLNTSLRKDFDSLMEYAIEHKSGGWYFPNAVMPFRGLLETEAYAHVFICDIIEDCSSMFEYKGLAAQPSVVADGLRLWLMVQKETQNWDESPAFVEALSTILAGSEEVLATRILALSKTVELPFSAVKKAENGMRVTRTFSVKRVSDRKETFVPLKEGEELYVGDVIKAEYKIWNEENRSFVRLSAPRMASMRPIQQLSGRYGWWLSPLRIAGWYTFSPQGYRNVLRNGSEYWFDSYPEENTTISEEFYITQAGVFQMPAMEIECLYAPHYRANDAAHSAIRSSTSQSPLAAGDVS